VATSALNESNVVITYSEINGDDGAGASAHIIDEALCQLRFDEIICISDDTADQTLTWALVDSHDNERRMATVVVPHGSGLSAAQFDALPHIKTPNSDGVVLPQGWGCRLISVAGITAGKRISVIARGGTL
jgi:hypothetical protein